MKTLKRSGIVFVLLCLLLQFNGFAETSPHVDGHRNGCDTVLAASSAPVPTISFAPSSFSFNATEGSANPPSQTLEVWNSGNGTLDWSASDDVDWLTLTPPSGNSTAEHTNITVSVDIAGLGASSYDAVITITSANASNSPQTVPVTLVISPPEPKLAKPKTDIKRPFWHESTGPPEWLKDRKASASGLPQAEAHKPEAIARGFLRSYQTALGIKEGAGQWDVDSTTTTSWESPMSA